MPYAEIPETAERPTRGAPGEVFMNMPGWYKTRHPEVMRHRWLRTDFEDRGLFDGPVNPVRMEVDNPGGLTRHLEETLLEWGADIVGVCEFVPEFFFADTEPPPHEAVISFGVKMTFDEMKRIWHVDTEVCLPYFKKYDGCKLCLMVCPYNLQGAQKKRIFTSRRRSWAGKKRRPGSGSRNGPPKPRTRSPGVPDSESRRITNGPRTCRLTSTCRAAESRPPRIEKRHGKVDESTVSTVTEKE